MTRTTQEQRSHEPNAARDGKRTFGRRSTPTGGLEARIRTSIHRCYAKFENSGAGRKPGRSLNCGSFPLTRSVIRCFMSARI
jgi:hypothetical protein